MCHFSYCTVFVSLTGLTYHAYTNALSDNEAINWVQEHVFTVPFLDHGDPHVLITTSFRKPVNVSVSIPGVGFEINNTIAKESPLFDVDLVSHHIYSRAICMLPDVGKQNKTFIVRSSDMVNVHVVSNDKGGDGFVVIPTNYLGTTHYVVSLKSQRDKSAFVCITAFHENTSVYIRTKTIQLRETLHQYESYRFDGNWNEDLSGTLVRSGKPIAVIAGVFAKISGTGLVGFWDGIIY